MAEDEGNNYSTRCLFIIRIISPEELATIQGRIYRNGNDLTFIFHVITIFQQTLNTIILGCGFVQIDPDDKYITYECINPMNDFEVNEIPIVEIKEKQANYGLYCVICLENFILFQPKRKKRKSKPIKKQVKKLSCGHIYHHCCIVPWLRSAATCPICRKVVF